MTVKTGDVAALTVMLSPERLAAFTHLTGSAQTAIELHQETLQLGASLMNVTAVIEIALRNSVCENLKQHFGVPNWLLQPPVSFQWRKTEQTKIILALDNARSPKCKAHASWRKPLCDILAYPQGMPHIIPPSKRDQHRRKHIMVSEGHIIAELTLSFWKKLYSHEYEQSLWHASLKRTFPHKKLSRSFVATRLEQIYRSATGSHHHEPVFTGGLRTR